MLGGERAGFEVPTCDADRAVSGRDDSGQATKRSCFACAIRTHESEDFTGLYGEGQVTDRREIAIEFGQRLDIDHRRRRKVQFEGGLGIADYEFARPKRTFGSSESAFE